jgi:hypothetical protein
VSSLALATPDFGDPRPLLAWLEASRAALRQLRPTAELIASVTPHDPPPDAPVAPLGRFADPRWRAFVSATYLADLASYPEPVCQVDFARLLHVMAVFPRGFRLWSAELPGVGRLPVGYSGWYPIAAASLAAIEGDPASLRDRMVVPLAQAEPGGSFVYLFNFSVVPELKGTGAARRLVQAYASDLHAERPRGLAAVTVSASGARVVERFGMTRVGTMTTEGCEETVFTRRYGA